MLSKARVGIPKASWASVTLGWTQSGSAMTCPGLTDGLRHLVEPHVTKTIESPGFHDPLLVDASEFLKCMAVGWNRPLIAAGGPDHLADIKVAARIEADVVRGEEVAGRARI